MGLEEQKGMLQVRTLGPLAKWCGDLKTEIAGGVAGLEWGALAELYRGPRTDSC